MDGRVGGDRRQWRRRGVLLGLLTVAALGLVACGPEAERTRGGGPGADIGNHGNPVQLRGDEPFDTRIYYQTPRDTPVVAP